MKINKSLIEDLIILEKSGMYGLGLAAEEYSESKVRYLRISDINDDGNIINSDKKSITAENIQNYLLEQDDLVVARTGNSTGRVYVYDQSDGILAYAGFLIKFVFDKNKINPRYMKYYCQSNYYKYQIKGFNGSTRGNMNANDFKTVQVFYPEREKQDKIVLLFDLLNNKIQVNNKINSELEAMAKTIYDYWFLQFEFPNEEGKPYKSSGGKMVWNDELKREIPEIFQNLLLKEIKNISVITGKTPSTKDETNFGNEVPFITIEDLRENVFVVNTKRKLSKKGANAQEKKYIPSGSICVSCIATIGEIAITTETSQTNQQINSVICGREEIRNYLYFYLKNIFLNFKVKSGNIFSNMNKEEFESVKILLPTENILVKFSKIISLILSKIEVNTKENQELTSLRDFLLPLLMNGQVGFKEEN